MGSRQATTRTMKAMTMTMTMTVMVMVIEVKKTIRTTQTILMAVRDMR